jgi:LPXTG-site transpeptidase (sortase) family protein
MYPDSDQYYGSGGRRGFFFFFSLVLFVAGLGILAFAVYNVFYDHEGPLGQLPFVHVEEQSRPPDGYDAPPPVETQRMVIPRIGVDAPVAAFGLDDNAIPEVPYDKDLIAWYTFSAPAGGGENAVFAGHVTWNGDAVFKRLGELEAGDEIVLRNPDGSQLIYRVFLHQVVNAADPQALDWMRPTGADVITIITCGGEYHRTNDWFGGEYEDRHMYRAELIARG